MAKSVIAIAPDKVVYICNALRETDAMEVVGLACACGLLFPSLYLLLSFNVKAGMLRDQLWLNERGMSCCLLLWSDNELLSPYMVRQFSPVS